MTQQADTPWRGRSIKTTTPTTPNTKRQRAALARMSQLERLCGMDERAWREFHRSQRERVLARYGVGS